MENMQNINNDTNINANNDEVLFCATTPQTLDRQLKFNLYHGRKGVLVFEISILIASIILALLLFLDDMLGLIVFCSIIIVVMVVFPFIYPSTLKKSVKKIMKKNPLCDQNVVNDFALYNDRIVVNSTRFDQNVSSATLLYANLIKVVQSNTLIIFYFGSVQAYLLDTDNLTNANHAQLTSFLQQKLADKFIVYKP